MADIFICYSNSEGGIARFLRRHLTHEGMQVLLASVSLQSGERWSDETSDELETSSWALFLASREACTLPWVQQELSEALATQKNLVPIVWDMPPSELPTWMQRHQALNLNGAPVENVKAQITAIANQVKSDKTQGLIAAGLMLAGLFWLGSK
jgi:hypothetical protein